MGSVFQKVATPCLTNETDRGKIEMPSALITNSDTLDAIADDAWREINELLHADNFISGVKLHETVMRALSEAYDCGERQRPKSAIGGAAKLRDFTNAVADKLAAVTGMPAAELLASIPAEPAAPSDRVIQLMLGSPDARELVAMLIDAWGPGVGKPTIVDCRMFGRAFVDCNLSFRRHDDTCVEFELSAAVDVNNGEKIAIDSASEKDSDTLPELDIDEVLDGVRRASDNLGLGLHL